MRLRTWYRLGFLVFIFLLATTLAASPDSLQGQGSTTQTSSLEGPALADLGDALKALVDRYGVVLFPLLLVSLSFLTELVKRFGVYAWYVIVLFLVGFGAYSIGNLMYFYAFALGLITAFAEIIGKFTDDPMKSMQTRQALMYHLLNGAIAAFSLHVLFLFKLPHEDALDKLKLVFAAGLGSMLVMRSKLFNVKLGGEEIALGPEQIIRVFFRFMEQAIDRERSRSRVEFVKAHMNNLDFDSIRPYSITMLDAAQALDSKPRQELVGHIESVRTSDLDPQLKSYRLGFCLLNQMGEDFVKQVFSDPRPEWLIERDLPEKEEKGLLSRLQFWGSKTPLENYFAYGSNMDLEKLMKGLGIPPKEKSKFLQTAKPVPVSLQGYTLVFNKPAKEEAGMGFANLQEDLSDHVEGILLRLPKEDITIMDGYKDDYERKIVRVLYKGKQVEATTFIARQTTEGLRPTAGYLAAMIQGATDRGLNADYVQRLRNVQPLTNEVSRN